MVSANHTVRPRESGDPARPIVKHRGGCWIPAYAGMSGCGGNIASKH